MMGGEGGGALGLVHVTARLGSAADYPTVPGIAFCTLTSVLTEAVGVTWAARRIASRYQGLCFALWSRRTPDSSWLVPDIEQNSIPGTDGYGPLDCAKRNT